MSDQGLIDREQTLRRDLQGFGRLKPVCKAALWRGVLRTRVERFACRATEPFESLHIRIPSKFCQNQENFNLSDFKLIFL